MKKKLHRHDRVSRTLSIRFRHNIKGENMNKELLLSIVERIERLNEDLENVTADIKEVYKEAKDSGFLCQ